MAKSKGDLYAGKEIESSEVLSTGALKVNFTDGTSFIVTVVVGMNDMPAHTLQSSVRENWVQCCLQSTALGGVKLVQVCSHAFEIVLTTIQYHHQESC